MEGRSCLLVFSGEWKQNFRFLQNEQNEKISKVSANHQIQLDRCDSIAMKRGFSNGSRRALIPRPHDP